MKRFVAKKYLLICLALFLTVKTNAEKDIIVDHTKRTITITANFTTFASIDRTLQEAVEIWNKQSGKYSCAVKADNVTLYYTVNFNLLVNYDMWSDIAQNEVCVIPNNNRLCRNHFMEINNEEGTIVKTIGVTDGIFIAINEKYKDNKYVLAHEIGHNLGMGHDKGLMAPYLGMNSISLFSIKEALVQLTNNKNSRESTLRKKIDIGITPETSYSYKNLFKNFM